MSNPSIRITKEEASSTQVDDFLKRQMSMRGDPGVTRDRSRKWYYQSWFVFMIVGGLGAFAAWAIIEPIFDDMAYIQGPISDINLEPGGKNIGRLSLKSPILGTITITNPAAGKEETITLLKRTKVWQPNGTKKPLDPGTLEVGQRIGVYTEYMSTPEEEIALCFFVDLSPKPQSSAREKLTLAQVASRSHAAGMMVFALVAGLIGLFVGASDGIICRLPRRAILCGAVGLVVGIVGGFICSIAAELAYAPLSKLAMSQSGDSGTGLSTFGFVLQMFGRGLAWCLAGVAMGLGQGIALRSKRLLAYGLLGGVVGGLLGGILFDPIDMILLGADKPSAHISRLIGFTVIGLCVGAMIGLVELLARDAWLRMTQGPLSGKEFLLFKDVMNVGASPKSDIYLFNDALVAKDHAIIRSIGDECEIEARDTTHPVLVNNRTVTRSRLRHGDNVTIGRTVFVFQRRKG